jgi:predicted dinucleotide-binding enzyme
MLPDRDARAHGQLLDHRREPAAPAQRVRRLAVLGAGHVGPVIARMAVAAGYEVSIAASGDPDAIALITQVLVPGGQPKWAAEAVVDADIVVLAIPLHTFADIDPRLLTDKLVVDAMNYWPPVDGVQPTFDRRDLGSSEIVAGRLQRSVVVKTLNHMGYHELEENRRPRGAHDRRALGVAGDCADAVHVVAELIEAIGFDAVRLPSLSAGRALDPGNPVFGASLTRAEFEAAVGRDREHGPPSALSRSTRPGEKP